MSETKNPLEAMLAQYEANNKPKYTKSTEAKVYNLDNYFNTYIDDKVKSATKTVRILPTQDGTSPFTELYAHSVQVDGKWSKIPCLKHEKGEACPFCEANDALRATGKDSDKELAKKYNAKLFYVVKVIDRDNEHLGVKFWRFAHDWRKEGILDKIQGVLLAIKKDVTNPETGRDLSITINRNQLGKPTVSSISHLDPSVLSEDSEISTEWLNDARTWEDVYAIKSYEYMEIVVKGGIPVWDKDEKKFVDRESVTNEGGDGIEAEITIGVENVKANVKASTTKTKVETVSETVDSEVTVDSEGTEDELPF
jgi:hypothetical protein